MTDLLRFTLTTLGFVTLLGLAASAADGELIPRCVMDAHAWALVQTHQ
ncbi:MAG TPA: hypothetical protein VF310_02420 [Vicinamibacteria bacterium]